MTFGNPENSTSLFFVEISGCLSTREPLGIPPCLRISKFFKQNSLNSNKETCPKGTMRGVLTRTKVI